MNLRRRLRTCLRLFLIFLKIGAFTFGGGYAMIPLIEYETAEKRDLIEKDEISDIVAIAESTPGPIAINSATFVGYRTAGVPGAAAATLGVVLPSFVIILVISFFLQRLMDYKVVQYAFFGVRAGVLALIVKAVVSFWKRADHHIFGWCVMVGAFAWAVLTDWSIIGLLALCGAAGFVYCAVQRKRGKLS